MEKKQDSMVSRVGFEPTAPTKTLLKQRVFEDSTEYLRNIASVESAGVTQSLRGHCHLCDRDIREGSMAIVWKRRTFCSEACHLERVKLDEQLDLLLGANDEPTQSTNS